MPKRSYDDTFGSNSVTRTVASRIEGDTSTQSTGITGSTYRTYRVRPFSYRRSYRSSYRRYKPVTYRYGRSKYSRRSRGIFSTFVPAGGREYKNVETTLAWKFTSPCVIQPATANPGTLLMNLACGTAANERIGRKVVLKTVQIKGQISYIPALTVPPGSNNAGCATAYMFLIWDKQFNATLPTMGEIFSGGLSAGIPQRNFMNIDRGSRFVVIRKWVWNFQAGAGGWDQLNNVFLWNGEHKSMEDYIKCNIPIVFGGTTGAISEMNESALYLVCGTDSGNDEVYFDGRARVRFIDD